MRLLTRSFWAVTALILSVATSASAQVKYDLATTTGGVRSWTNPANWNPIGVPGTTPDDEVNLSVPLVTNLQLNLGTSDIQLAWIVMGGTSFPVTTEINCGGAHLFLNNTLSDTVLVSGGVEGSRNQIVAPVILADTVVISEKSTQDLALLGDIGLEHADRTIVNNMIGGKTLTIGGPGSTIRLYEASNPAVGRMLSIKVYKDNSGSTAINTVIAAAWDDKGSGGSVDLGAVNNNPNATFVMAQSQPSEASVQINRQGYLLAADAGLGRGILNVANNNNPNWGCEIRSNDDLRVLANSLIVAANNFAFAGDHNLTVSSTLTQRSNRVVGNNVAASKEVIFTGSESAPAIAISERAIDGNRIWIMDGSGNSVVSGRVVNNLEADASISGTIWKRGSGRLELSNPGNTIRGDIEVQGGLLAFGVNGAWGATSGIKISQGGGLSYAPGAKAPGFATMISRIAADSMGFLALPGSDADTDLNFTTALSHVPYLSVAADGDLVYTGTVTPAPNIGYHWGGISGTLTLGRDASVGQNSVFFSNGGTVKIMGSQSYSGSTTIRQVQITTAQDQIASRSGSRGSPDLLSFATTVEVPGLADGGAAGVFGTSTSAAANLVIDGGVVRVSSDSGTSTNRLFTIGVNGAQLESSGNGAAVFAQEGGQIVTAGSGPRTLALSGSSSAANAIRGTLSNGANATTDLLSVHKTGSGTWVLNGNNDYGGSTVVSEGQLFVNGDQSHANGTYAASSAGTIGGSGILGGLTRILGGGTAAPGDGVGTLTVMGEVVLEAGGNLNWQIHDATGLAGDGWDMLSVGNGIAVSATDTNPFLINLWSLSAFDPNVTSGGAVNFNIGANYSWTIASAAGGITGFAAEKFIVNVAAANGAKGFTNDLGGGTFSVVQNGNDLNLVFRSANPSTGIKINVQSGAETQAQAGYPSITAADSVTKTGAGTLVFDAANAYTGPTTISAGTLQLTDPDGLAGTTVTVDTGAMLAITSGTIMKSPAVILAGGTLSATTLTVASGTGITSLAVNAGGITGAPVTNVGHGGTLTLAQNVRLTVALGALAVTEAPGGGRVDLGAGEVEVAAGGISAVDLRAEIIAGRNGGAWNGTTGITSSTAVESGGVRSVGYVINTDGSARVSFAAAGDVDLSGTVNVFDLVSINSSGKYGTGATSVWSQGYFNYDGVTNVFDLVAINTAATYGQGTYFPAVPSSTPLSGTAAVPEPGEWALLGLASAVTMAWVRLRRPYAKVTRSDPLLKS